MRTTFLSALALASLCLASTATAQRRGSQPPRRPSLDQLGECKGCEDGQRSRDTSSLRERAFGRRGDRAGGQGEGERDALLARISELRVRLDLLKSERRDGEPSQRERLERPDRTRGFREGGGDRRARFESQRPRFERPERPERQGRPERQERTSPDRSMERRLPEDVRRRILEHVEGRRDESRGRHELFETRRDRSGYDD